MTIDTPLAHHIPALRQLWQKAFGDSDEFLDGFFSVGFAPERCRVLLTEGNIAAMLYWFDCRWSNQKVAYLYAVATDPACQGKGFCRRLMENTHAHLQAAGYDGAILVPGEKDLFSLYRKIGYAPCCDATLQTVLAGTGKVSCKQIPAGAYAAAQKKYLPGDSVLHSQSTLVFAATFNKFYQGKGFAFCGAAEDDTFFFQEFLGDPAALPEILATLGAKKGVVRLPGGEPYAMYRSLNGDGPLPSRFGIPLN